MILILIAVALLTFAISNTLPLLPLAYSSIRVIQYIMISVMAVAAAAVLAVAHI